MFRTTYTGTLIRIPILILFFYFSVFSCILSRNERNYCSAGSSRGNGQSDRRRNRSTRVRTPVALLRSLSGKYPWERYEPPYPPSYGVNSTTTVLLGE